MIIIYPGLHPEFELVDTWFPMIQTDDTTHVAQPPILIHFEQRNPCHILHVDPRPSKIATKRTTLSFRTKSLPGTTFHCEVNLRHWKRNGSCSYFHPLIEKFEHHHQVDPPINIGSVPWNILMIRIHPVLAAGRPSLATRWKLKVASGMVGRFKDPEVSSSSS